MKFESAFDIALFVIQVIACISFATSGAITAIRKKTDILGIIILTLISIFGGGLLRDLIINQGAPHCFYDQEYLIMEAVSIGVSILWFLLAYFKKTAWLIDKHRHDLWIYILDAIGIAAFCVSGVKTAAHSLSASTIAADNVVGQYIYMICLGVITGVGGGMFRDIFAGEIPTVFKKHFYMTPCIIGTTIFALMYQMLPEVWVIPSTLICIGIIVALRILATIYRWNLPTAKGYNELQKENDKISR